MDNYQKSSSIKILVNLVASPKKTHIIYKNMIEEVLGWKEICLVIR